MSNVPLSDSQIAELWRLEAEATAGPWHRLHDIANSKNPTCKCAQVWSKAVDWPVAFCDTRADGEGLYEEKQMANAALVAASRNALQALLSELDQSRVERKEMMQLLADAVTLIEGETRGVRSITTTEGHAFVKVANALISRARQRTQTE